MNERRKALRFKKRISCELAHDDRHHSGIVLDVSQSGLFVQTNAKPRPGDVVGVALNVPGERRTIDLRARVARTKLVPPQLLSVAQGGLGLHIENPPAEYLEFVENVSKPVKMEQVSILQTSDPKPGATKKKAIPQHARDRLEALRARTSKVKVAPSASVGRVSREKTPSTELPRFRVRLLEVGTAVSRSFIVSCGSEDEARERVVSEMGDDWKIDGIDRL